MSLLQVTLNAIESDTPNFVHLGQKFRKTEPIPPETLAFYIGGFVTVILLATGIYFYRRYRSRRIINNPDQLLGELFRVHHINNAERKAIRRAIKATGITHPGTLFTNPEAWESLDGPTGDAALLNAVQQRIFG